MKQQMDSQDPHLTQTDIAVYTVPFNTDVNEIDFYDKKQWLDFFFAISKLFLKD